MQQIQKEEDPLSAIIHPSYVVGELNDRAKGYSGTFRRLLLAAAALIRGYEEAYPFRHCVSQWQHAFVHAGARMAADVATEMDCPEVAKTILSREISARDIDASTNRIMLHYASLVRARELLTELKDAGILDAEKYAKDLTAIFYELPKAAPVEKAAIPVKA